MTGTTPRRGRGRRRCRGRGRGGAKYHIVVEEAGFIEGPLEMTAAEGQGVGS